MDISQTTVEPPSGARNTGPRVALFLAVMLLAGLLLRTVFLGRASYWIDEINIINVSVTADSVADIYRLELGRFNWYHVLPFLSAVVHVVIKTVGYTGAFPPEWLARILFALCATASLYLFYLLGRTVRGLAVGLWAVFLGTFSVFHLFYSREVYAYSLLIFFGLGCLWTGIETVRRTIRPDRFRWPFALGYMLFSTLFLQTHMSALLFLVPWTGLLGLTVLLSMGWKKTFSLPSLGFWMLTLGASFAVFFPFLVRMFGGYTTTDDPSVETFSLKTILAVLGRMGWGEHWATMIPFVIFLVLGGAYAVRDWKKKANWTGLLIVAQGLLYFALQSWMLIRTQSRFEVRYYHGLFPLMMVLVGWGIEQSATWVAAKRNFRVEMLRGIVGGAILLWAIPSLVSVCTLQCRGYSNYRALANWINANLSTNGVYSFYNSTEMRAVPRVYPTPGRIPTSVADWSSEEDFKRVDPPGRAVSLFMRFPLIVFAEFAPDDLLCPHGKSAPIPRDQLFMRHEWIGDKSWSRLHRLKTFPVSEVHPQATNSQMVLVSYNKPEDLPALAAKRQQVFYSYFGPDWGYVKDNRMNGWKITESSGTVFIGNISGRPASGVIKVAVLGYPSGGLLSVYGPDGRKLLDKTAIQPDYQMLTLPAVELQPGLNSCRMEIMPAPGSPSSALLVYGVVIEGG